MLTRLHLDDWRVILHYLGTLILLLAGSMCIPFVVALVLEEYASAVIFLKSAGLTLCIGALLNMAKIKRGTLDMRQALVVTGLSWIVLSFFGTIPLWFSGHYANFVDALFEGVSGLTATGLTMVIDIDHMALSMNLWRFIMHLLGGIGVLVIALALGIFGSGSSAAAIYQAEARDSHVMPELKQTSQFIAKVSVVVIAAGFIACSVPLLLAGLSPLRAAFSSLCITISAFATGGMVPQSTGIMFYHSWPLEIITLLLMFFGIINFMLYGYLWKGQTRHFFKDIEVRTLGVWMTVLVLLMMAALTVSSNYFTDVSSMVRRALYLVISAATNVGFTTTYSGQLIYGMGSGCFFIIALAMIVGGSASSTTGGIKAFRVGIIAKTVLQTIREALAPDRMRPRTFYYHQGPRLLEPELASSALAVFLLYILTFAVGAVAGIIYGYEAIPAIFESISAASNGGLSSGIVTPGMPVGLEVIYIFEMWLGRLEFVAIFAMLVQFVASLVPFGLRRPKRRRGAK